MMRVIFFLLAPFLFFACKKNSGQSCSLTGIYHETKPFAGNTQLHFINSNQVVVIGGRLSNPSYLKTDTEQYYNSGQNLFFVADSAAIKDTLGYWYGFSGNDLTLSNCPPGAQCFVQSYFLTFSR